jgi:hypothetical protein
LFRCPQIKCRLQSSVYRAGTAPAVCTRLSAAAMAGMLGALFLFTSPVVGAQWVGLYNDSMAWDFQPEWDDFETYSLRAGASVPLDADDELLLSLLWGIYTRRPTETGDPGSRIDGLDIGVAYGRNAGSWLVTFGCGASYFGNLLGYTLQAGWHERTGILRPVPTMYEPHFIRLSATFGAQVEASSLGLTGGLNLALQYPLQDVTELWLEQQCDPDSLPLRNRLGFRWITGIAPDEVIAETDASLCGLYLESSFELWPFRLNRSLCFTSMHGTGGFDVLLCAAPPAPPGLMVERTIYDLSALAWTVKIKKGESVEVGPVILTPGWYASIDSGYSAPVDLYPDIYRYAALAGGVDVGMLLQPGVVSIEPYVTLGGAIRQDRHYNAGLERAIPDLEWWAACFECGAGVRTGLIRVADRWIGVGCEYRASFRAVELTGSPGGDLPAAVEHHFSIIALVSTF